MRQSASITAAMAIGWLVGCSSGDLQVGTPRARTPETGEEAKVASHAQAITASGSCPQPAAGLTQMFSFPKGDLAWFGTVSPQNSNANGQPLGVVSPLWNGVMRGTQIPGCSGTALHFLSTVTARGEGYGWGPFPNAIKLSDYKGFALWVRGTSRRGISLSVATGATVGKETHGDCVPSDGKRCYGFHTALIPLTDEWRETRIPFSDLHQPDWAVPADLDLKDVRMLGMVTLPNEQDVWLAAVNLYR